MLSFRRLYALLRKEWIQITRDAITLRFIVALPIVQLFLFGFAINTNPQHLPTGLLLAENSKYERTIVAALRNSGYYDIRMLASEAEAERALAQGDLMFVVAFPPNFDRSVDRGDQPQVLIDADATDPSAIGYATAALATIANVLDRDLPPVMRASPATPAFQFVIHARYNPEQLTVLNTVPGLICIVLMMSTLFMTTLSITKERERGTMENLLAMPVRPVEVMLAKIVPYVLIGYIQVFLILISSAVFFQTAAARFDPDALGRTRPVHRRQPGARHYVLHGVDQPDAGHAVRPVHPDAVVPLVRLHVSVPRHAAMGAVDRRNLPDHPRDADRARRAAQGQRRRANPPRTVADRAVHGGRRLDCGMVLSRDAGIAGT